MKIKAIWIIDKEYILPTYLSIVSFLQAIQVPVLLVYCGKEGVQDAATLFKGLHDSIVFETFDTPVGFRNHPQKGIITNRLARMYYAQKSADEIVMLLDSDTLFSKQGDELITQIELEYKNYQSAICGVLDAPIAYRDYLYFRTKDDTGRDVVVPHLEQKDIYKDVFGLNWWHQLKGASINNGVVAFFNCTETIKQWRKYYLQGLKYNKVNPADDQLPLAAAIHTNSQKVITLPEKFNSKGKVLGDFVVYHAFSSIWKMQIIAASRGEEGVSDFTDLARNLLPFLPQKLLSNFIANQKNINPFLFRGLDGKFGFQHLYEDIVVGIESGTIVEVGMKNGKSTCFMMELIRNAGKDIQFFALETFGANEQKRIPFFQIVDRFALSEYANFLEKSKDQIPSEIEGEVDFVFLNLGNNYEEVYENLELWYPRIKAGGVMAGYDYTSQIGLDFGNACATFDFCRERNLSLRISFNIFIIEKPDVKESLSKSIIDTLVLNDSNVGL